MPRPLVLLIVAITPLALYIAGKRIYWTYFKNPPVRSYAITDYMTATAQIQAMLTIDSGDIVFVGNSLTSNFPVSEMFGTLKIKNRGIGNNRMKDILDRITGIVRSKPSKIFIEGGVNDLLDNRSVTDIITDYKKVIAAVRAPTILFVQSTCPVVDIDRDIQPGIDSLNICLRRYCDSAGVTFIDMDRVLKKNGKLNPELTWDGIHLNDKGYMRWYGVAKKFL